MVQTILLSAFTGIWLANGFPHLIKGITRERYPTLLGHSPVINFIAGWTAFATAPLFLYFAHPAHYPIPAIAAGAFGFLLMGLFHAGPGAIGKKENKPSETGVS